MANGSRWAGRLSRGTRHLPIDFDSGELRRELVQIASCFHAPLRVQGERSLASLDRLPDPLLGELIVLVSRIRGTPYSIIDRGVKAR